MRLNGKKIVVEVQRVEGNQGCLCLCFLGCAEVEALVAYPGCRAAEALLVHTNGERRGLHEGEKGGREGWRLECARVKRSTVSYIIDVVRVRRFDSEHPTAGAHK